MKVIKNSLFIFYVKEQARSRLFYEKVLGHGPILDVPGMTEFQLSQNAVLGLMPEKGILNLLEGAIVDPSLANGIARSELYLLVEDANIYHQRALNAGAIELSPLKERSWGECVAYSKDLDGHILAFGTPLNRLVKEKSC